MNFITGYARSLGKLPDRYWYQLNGKTAQENYAEQRKNIYEALAEPEAEAIRDSIKAEMAERETEELIAGNYIIRWTSVLSSRFDTTGFKKVYGELYKAFTKQTASRRFSISC